VILESIAILLAGVAAGGINAAVGSGTLITFPVLIAFGYPPVVANVSNTIGLVPGSTAGAVGYRRELTNLRPLILRIGVASVLGGLTGAALLLVLPASTFEAVVPVLVGAALVLVVLQPVLVRRLARHRSEPNTARVGVGLLVLLYVTGVYGGYFGAGQGIVLLGILGAALPMSLHGVNAIKNILAGATNCVAGIVFATLADVDWTVAALIAAGSLLGGWLGAHTARRLPAPALRALIVCVGAAAVVKLVV
jgi:uncharacterized membrane protein YfcA